MIPLVPASAHRTANVWPKVSYRTDARMELGNNGSVGKKSSKASHYRSLAADCEKRAAVAAGPKRDEFLRKAKAYRALAESEEWLEGKNGGAEKPADGEET